MVKKMKLFETNKARQFFPTILITKGMVIHLKPISLSKGSCATSGQIL